MEGLIRVTSTALLVACWMWAQPAAAQGAAPAATVKDTQVEAKGAGIAGGIIVGAELVLAVESIIKVKPLWPWLVFPAVGAAGGGVGGYYLRKASPEGAVALLVVGMAAVIPTAIGIATSRRYNPELEGARTGDGRSGKVYSFEMEPVGETTNAEADAVTEVEARPEEGPPAPDSVEEPEPAGGDAQAEPEDAAPESRNEAEDAFLARVAHLSSGALFHLHPTFGFGMGIPAVDVRPVVRTPEDAPGGRVEAVEFHVPLLALDLP